MTMTIDQANQIWTACYGAGVDTAQGWKVYSNAQRLQAIETRNAHAAGGQWGSWNISDRH